MLIYLTGVMAGSLTVAVADPTVFLAGASGGGAAGGGGTKLGTLMDTLLGFM